MIRKFRAIVQTPKEPQDHEVLWYWKGKVLFWDNGEWQPFHLIDSEEIKYASEEAEEVSTVQEALDKLLYITPEIDTFTLKQAGTYERGTVIDVLDFSWSYNKNLIKKQRLDDIDLIPTIRQVTIETEILSDTTFTLWASDNINEATSRTSIQFVDYIYYGILSSTQGMSIHKVHPTNTEISVIANNGSFIWVFIPYSTNYTKILHNNVDSTDAFIVTPQEYRTDTGALSNGIMYISKHANLGQVTLKFE